MNVRRPTNNNLIRLRNNKPRKTWQIKPVERVKNSNKIYKRQENKEEEKNYEI